MEIKINPEINNLANEILAKEQAKKDELKATEKYIKKCIKAMICPICGEPLLKREATKKEEKESCYDCIEYVLYCDKSEFTHIEGWYDNDED